MCHCHRRQRQHPSQQAKLYLLYSRPLCPNNLLMAMKLLRHIRQDGAEAFAPEAKAQMKQEASGQPADLGRAFSGASAYHISASASCWPPKAGECLSRARNPALHHQHLADLHIKCMSHQLAHGCCSTSALPIFCKLHCKCSLMALLGQVRPVACQHCPC